MKSIDVKLKPLIKNIAVTATPKLQDIEIGVHSNILYAFSPSAKIEKISNGNYLITITDKEGTTTGEVPVFDQDRLISFIDEYFNSRSVIADFLEEYNNQEESRLLIKNLILNAVSDLENEINSLTTFVNRINQEKLGFRVDTKQNWDSQRNLISEQGVIYFYTNYKARQLENNIIQNIPAMKLGDGKAFLIDLPFMGGDTIEFEQHIKNKTIHITQQERQEWNNKIVCSVTDDNLVFENS